MRSIGLVALRLCATLVLLSAVGPAAAAHADNSRLNRSVITNVYAVQHQAGCPAGVKWNVQLQLAAEWHTRDLMEHRDMQGHIGSDGSTVMDRTRAAGFSGQTVETVAINPALAINGIEIMNQWFSDPVALAVMRDCSHSAIGVWSENSLDRTVVVAVYGVQVPA